MHHHLILTQLCTTYEPLNCLSQLNCHAPNSQTENVYCRKKCELSVLAKIMSVSLHLLCYISAHNIYSLLLGSVNCLMVAERTTKHGLNKSLLDPASDCTATCILVFNNYLNTHLINAYMY